MTTVLSTTIMVDLEKSSTTLEKGNFVERNQPNIEEKDNPIILKNGFL